MANFDIRPTVISVQSLLTVSNRPKCYVIQFPCSTKIQVQSIERKIELHYQIRN